MYITSGSDKKKSVRLKIDCYIGVFQREFDRDSAVSTKMCPLAI